MRRILRRLLGKPRDLRDPNLFHNVSLIAFFAWVGLGADGLSSSAYGPEEAFRHLEGHTYLAVFLAIGMGLTVAIISFSYSRIIEHFPSGGGGYLVATKLLGERAGVISGCALLVDYVLTITISVAAGADAIFAFLPPAAQQLKLPAEAAVIITLVIMNLRGVKESVLILTPIFLAFIVTHAIVIVATVVPHIGEVGPIVTQVRDGLSHDVSTMGLGALTLVFLRAYALGGGTYTGIEAVSNGLAIMREPRVETAKRTMGLMAASLAFTASGILLAYLLTRIQPSAFEPMNATLTKTFAAGWRLAGLDVGQAFVVLTLLSSGALLFVAAQAGFIDGPRVMANMALDSWLPRQLASLSERLTIRDGIYIMGAAALAALLYTHGDVHLLVIMYSINVFLTFSLSNLGMVRLWLSPQAQAQGKWKRNLATHLGALALCAGILVLTIYERFLQGGWVTLVVTAIVIGLCYAVRAHYRHVAQKIRRLDDELGPLLHDVPATPLGEVPEMDPERSTAVVLVGGYSGLGIHTLRQVERNFPEQFRQAVFISAAIIDSGTFKGVEELQTLKDSTRRSLEQYVTYARNKLGWAADHDMVIGTDVVAELERVCREVYLRFPRSVFFAGKLIFREPSWWQRLLHNETANAVQRRLEFDGLPMVILPVRVLK